MQSNSIVISQRSWLYGAGCLFCVEVFIAAFLHDRIVRPYVGDLLAVVFLYCLVRSVVTTPVRPTVAAVLLVAYGIEALQYLHLLTYVGLQHSRLAAMVLGNHFEWGDMLAYTLGALGVLAAEQAKSVYNQRYA
jgi:hypothetical protein